MRERKISLLRTGVLFVDLLILSFSFTLGYFMRKGSFDFWEKDYLISLFIYCNVFWILVSYYTDIHNIYRFYQVERIIRVAFTSIIMHALFIITLVYLIKSFSYSREFLFYTYIWFAVLLLIWRFFTVQILKALRRMGFNLRRAVIVNTNRPGRQLMKQLKTDVNYGMKFLGFFDNAPASEVDSSLLLGDLSVIKNYCTKNRVDEMYYSQRGDDEEQIRDLLDFCERNFIRFRIIFDNKMFFNKKVSISFYGFTPIITFREEPLESYYNRFIKRGFDIIFSLLVIIIFLSWLIPLLSLLIRLDSKGPVFFVQERSGLKNKSFRFLKFRTMKVNNESDEVQATKDDSRITRIGKFLRKTSLDEIPQFFNVLTGQMSVVGPRPHMLKHTKDYSAIIDTFMIRHMVKPGITGLAQVRGFRGGTDEPGLMEKRVEWDVYYLENWSMLLDVKIIFLTVLNIFRGEKNAY